MKSYLCFIILLFSLSQYEFASKRHSVYFTGYRCEDVDKRILIHIECFMVPDAHGQLMMNMRFMVSEDLKKDFMWRFALIGDIWSRRNVSYLNMTMDYCQSLNTSQKHLLLRYVFEEINRKGNMPVECPLKANVMYEVRNFSLHTKIIPNVFPTLTWHASLQFGLRNITVLHLHLFGRLDKLK